MLNFAGRKYINNMKKLTFLFLIIFLPLMASAYDAKIEGIYYNFDTNTKEATVTYGDTKYTGDVYIPHMVEYRYVSYKVTSIGDDAFSKCSSLTGVYFSSINLTSIGNRAFTLCTALTSITNSVTHIGTYVFDGCLGLTSVNISDNITIIDNGVFSGCSGLTSVKIPDCVTYIGYSAFRYSGLTSITIPNSLRTIGKYAFEGCSGLTSIKIPNNVTNIGEHAFYKCSNLAEVEINSGAIVSKKTDSSSSLQSIFDSQVKTFILGENVKIIGDHAFEGCSCVTSVIIPNSVTSIGNAAFANCIELADVYCYAEQIPTTGNDVFKDSYINYITLYVPASAANAYKMTAPWSEFGNIVALPEPTLRGDVNGDGVVNGTDIQAIINLIVAGEYDEKADINKDNIINGTDIQEVINIIVNAE